MPKLDLDGIDWVIVGGESGPRARPMEASWVIDILITSYSDSEEAPYLLGRNSVLFVRQ